MSYTLRDHTADVAVEAHATTLAEAFAAVGDGLAAAMCDDIPQNVGERFELRVAAEDVEAALFDYLDQLIYERDVRNVLPVDNEVSIRESGGEWIVEASARGVPLSEVHAREIKAVTYSEMEIGRVDDAWRAYVVFDV